MMLIVSGKRTHVMEAFLDTIVDWHIYDCRVQ